MSRKIWIGAFVLCLRATSAISQLTYCNPINIDYGYTPIPDFAKWGKHRATADPVIVNFKNDFYLFSTNQWGYWVSSDMNHWNFHSRRFLRAWNVGTYDELCAPAVGVIGDTMIVMGSTYTRNFTIWMSTDPKNNVWKPLVDSFEIGGWDPAFFTDDDGRLYMYNGSSNVFPLYGVELDRKTLKPKGYRAEMHLLKSWRYGWQRFGEHNDNTFLDPFIEGAWMTKHNKKYYLQYGAPGTEFSGYADGVAVSDQPLGNPFGNFIDQSDPLSIRAAGFARGAGHGATYQDNNKNFWHVSTIMLSTKNNFERRIGIWPSGFDKDGIMWCNTAFGDYPHYLPNTNDRVAHAYGDRFTGWMLLNYKKPITVSSTLGSFHANHVNDESMKTYWSALTGDKGEWIVSDLGAICTVNAIQINYADQDAEFLGKSAGVYHQYIMYQSNDGINWLKLVDKSMNKTDVPHDYIELTNSIKTRYIKLENIKMPTGKFAISGLRIFGRGNGVAPNRVETFFVLRGEKDKRDAWIKWSPMDDADGYNIYYGTQPDKLYSCLMVMDLNEYWFKGMDSQKTYYFTIEPFNENGVGMRYEVLKVE